MDVELANTQDVLNWRLTNSGISTVKSMYLDLLNGHTIHCGNTYEK